MKDQNLKIIHAACLAANPSILDLVFGCEMRITTKQGTRTHHIVVGQMPSGDPITIDVSGVYNPKKPAGANVEEMRGTKEILGRPIRLADVLVATLSKDAANRTRVTLESSGQFITTSPLENIRMGGPIWNLRADRLEDQSEETLAFVAGLLK